MVKKRYSRRKRAGSKSMATVARRVVKAALKKNIELKFFDTPVNFSLDVNGDVKCLSLIAQGDTDFDRNGDKAIPKSISGKYLINVNPAATFTGVRVIIFQWFGDDLIDDPTPAKLMQTTGDFFAPLSHYNFDGMRAKKFKVLYDKFHILDPITDQCTQGKMYSVNMKPIAFDAASTHGSGHIYWLGLSDAGAGSGDEPGLLGRFRVTYTDA